MSFIEQECGCGRVWRGKAGTNPAQGCPDCYPEPASPSEQMTVADYEEVQAEHRQLVRRLDVALNGERGAARQASLCDIVGQLEDMAPIEYDPAWLRSEGWKYDAARGFWINERTATACRGWLSATLEQRRRDRDMAQRLAYDAANPSVMGTVLPINPL